ncbi:hypothetical protein K523DRAFT_380591 [Schizophyllum commune Tattone D]|nr:hypothetical protein K523DRAFT_380591 [Schizophyllum commune Tattone D]
MSEPSTAIWLSRCPRARPLRPAQVGSAAHLPLLLPLPLSCGRGEPPSRRFSASRETCLAPRGDHLGALCTQPIAAGVRSVPSCCLPCVPRPSPYPPPDLSFGRARGARATSSRARVCALTTRGAAEEANSH